MRIAVTGYKGQLGLELQNTLKKHELVLIDKDTCDITQKDQVSSFLNKSSPEAIIHAAAYTDVDGCEKNPELAKAVNVEGTRNLVEYAKENKVLLLYISTDYVFDGAKKGEYKEDDPTNPISIYSKTKLEGEVVVHNCLEKYFIARTAWLYGQGNNFVNKIMGLSKKNKLLKVVNDQFGSPTYAKDLAEAVSKLIFTDDYGLYHIVNSNNCSRYEFANEIINLTKSDTRVIPVPSSEFKILATRPANSILDISKLQSKGIYMRDWKEALKEYIETYFL